MTEGKRRSPNHEPGVPPEPEPAEPLPPQPEPVPPGEPTPRPGDPIPYQDMERENPTDNPAPEMSAHLEVERLPGPTEASEDDTSPVELEV